MIKFKNLVDSNDYTLTVNSSGGGHLIQFLNTELFETIKQNIAQSNYPMFVFENDSIHFNVTDYVCNYENKTIQFIGYVSSNAWTNAMVAKTIPLYIVV